MTAKRQFLARSAVVTGLVFGIVLLGVALTATPAAAQADADVETTVSDATISGSGETTYTVTVTNTGSSQQTFTIDDTELPDGWSVGGYIDPGHKQVTLDSWEKKSVSFTVVPDGNSETGSVTFGVWEQTDCGFLCTDAKGNWIGYDSASVTVDGDSPTIDNIQTNIDGRSVTVYADISDASFLGKKDVTFNPSGPLNSETITMARVGGDTYSATKQLSWGTSFEYDVYAEDEYGQSTETTDYSDSVPAAQPPEIEWWNVDRDGREISVSGEVAAGSGSVNSVNVNWETGGFLSGLNPFNGQSMTVRGSAGQFSATIPNSGTFSFGDKVKVGISVDGEFKDAKSDQRSVEIPQNSPPQISDPRAQADGQYVTFKADVTDDQGVSKVDVTVDPSSGWLPNSESFELTDQDSDGEYTKTAKVGWGVEFEYDVYAEDIHGKSTETPNSAASTPKATKPSVDIQQATVDGREITVDVAASSGSGSIQSVEVFWDAGSFGGLNPFSGGSTEVGSGPGSYTVTVPDSGTFNWGDDVKVGAKVEGEYNTVETATSQEIPEDTTAPEIEVVDSQTKVTGIPSITFKITDNRAGVDIGGSSVKYGKEGILPGYDSETEISQIEDNLYQATFGDARRVGNLHYKLSASDTAGNTATFTDNITIKPVVEEKEGFIGVKTGPLQPKADDAPVLLADQLSSQAFDSGTRIAVNKLASKAGVSGGAKLGVMAGKLAGLGVSLIFSAEAVNPPSQIQMDTIKKDTLETKDSVDRSTFEQGDPVFLILSEQMGVEMYDEVRITVQSEEDETERTVRRYPELHFLGDDTSRSDVPGGKLIPKDPLTFEDIESLAPGEKRTYTINAYLYSESGEASVLGTPVNK